MWNQLKQWKQPPVSSGMIIALLLLTGLLCFFMIFTNSNRPIRLPQSRNSPDLGLFSVTRPQLELQSKAIEGGKSFAPNSVPQKKNGLKIIKTASIRFQVKDYQQSRAIIETIVKNNNGYFASENQHNGTDRIESTIVIRVPAENLERLLKSLEGQAVYLEHKSIEARDVTEEFVDTEARLKAKREVESRYLAILKQATTVKDILEVESHLGSIREEIETIEGKLKYLNDQIAYSVITLYIYQPVHRFPRPERDFVEELGKALINGWNGLLGVIIALVGLWPLFLTLYGGWVIYHHWRKKKALSK